MNNRNRFLDVIKLLACFMVIIIHTKGIGVADEYVVALTRWAVPFFFVLTGMYFFKNDLSKENIRKCSLKKGLKFLKILLIVEFVYLLYSLVYYLCRGVSFIEWLELKFNLTSIVRFFINSTLVKDAANGILHLWFLVAIVKCSIVFLIIAPIFKSLYKYITVVALFSVYAVNIASPEILKNIHFSWLLTGLAFLLIGVAFSDYFNTKVYKLTESEQVVWQQKVMRIAPTIIIVGILSTIMETYFMGTREIYFGSLLIVISVILLSECDIQITDKIEQFETVPANTYFYHVLFLNVLNIVVPQVTWYKPFVIFLICLIVFYILQKAKRNKVKQ